MKDINKLGLVGTAVIIFAVVALVTLDDNRASDGATKSRDEVTYSQLTLNSIKASEQNDLENNLTIHIATNAAQNVSIWKGDEMVCYIPRGA
jgi:hypothetical protein